MSGAKRHISEEELIGEQIQVVLTNLDVNCIHQAIIAPPAPDKKERQKSNKGGWKKKNREYCEACLDGGELICCEKCPLSFHPSCCDPPCDASDLPDRKKSNIEILKRKKKLGNNFTQRWVCKICTGGDNVEQEELDPLRILTVESEQQNPSEFDIDQLVKEGGRRDLPIPGQTRLVDTRFIE